MTSSLGLYSPEGSTAAGSTTSPMQFVVWRLLRDFSDIPPVQPGSHVPGASRPLDWWWLPNPPPPPPSFRTDRLTYKLSLCMYVRVFFNSSEAQAQFTCGVEMLCSEAIDYGISGQTSRPCHYLSSSGSIGVKFRAMRQAWTTHGRERSKVWRPSSIHTNRSLVLFSFHSMLKCGTTTCWNDGRWRRHFGSCGSNATLLVNEFFGTRYIKAVVRVLMLLEVAYKVIKSSSLDFGLQSKMEDSLADIAAWEWLYCQLLRIIWD